MRLRTPFRAAKASAKGDDSALARRIAIRTESQDPASGPALASYLIDEIGPTLATLGFEGGIHANPQAHDPPFGPLLIGHCINRLILSDIKLVLLEALPPETPVTVLQQLGTAA